jgi:hypothetical protein
MGGFATTRHVQAGGDWMRVLQGLVSAVAVAVGLALWLVYWMGASLTFAVAAGVVIGLAILAVVGTRSGPRDLQADAAWREAAPDLPPGSDRLVMEASQVEIAGPEKAKSGRRPRTQTSGTAGQGATR